MMRYSILVRPDLLQVFWARMQGGVISFPELSNLSTPADELADAFWSIPVGFVLAVGGI